MLNSQQQEAVYSDAKRIVCLAGAGAGKTYTLIQRISRLVDKSGVDPSSILVLTFTRAAAFEMQERYCSTHVNQETPNFRTFHSFCYSLLASDREVRNAMGYSSVPTIAAEVDVKRVRTKAQLQCHTTLSDAKLSGEVALNPREEFQLTVYTKALNRLLRKENIITFDILCEGVCKLFSEDDPSIQKYKSQYCYVFVDEFQDTDPTQAKFIESFKSASIFVVGDALQAIYGWRNADSRLIKRYVDSEDWETIKLYHNYRSTKCICEFANKNTQYADPRHRIELATDKSGGCVNVHILKHRCDPYVGIQTQELFFLRDTIPTLSGNTAILVRTNEEVRMIRQYLRSCGTAYVTGQRNEEAAHIVKAVQSNEYLVKWAATYLNTARYGQYIRLQEIDNPEDLLEWFTENFYEDPNVQSRIDTVRDIRDILTRDWLPYQMCEAIFNTLKVPSRLTDTNATTAEEILDYVLSEVSKEADSDVYVGTIHSSKGLEYDNVILLGVNDRSFRLDTEDSQNLYYVGITRAKTTLHVWIVDEFNRIGDSING